MNNDEEVALAIELLDSGVPQARVRELFEGRIDPDVLVDIFDMKKHRTGSRDDDVDPNIRRLVDEMRPPEQYLDPLYRHLMRDPVALSSGHIFDRSSVVDSNRQLKFRICPVSSKILDGSVFTLTPKKREIEHFKATRDRNVTEISRKMIASGDYDSFHLVLEGVENYIRSLGENYLPLARELAAMWSGVREASSIMLLAENVDSQSYSRSHQTIVSSGGLQDKVFRIIVSAEHFRDQASRRDDKSGLYLSLFNDHDLLVERCKLFDCHQERNTKHHQIFGKHDRIVTKSKSGFSYKLECMSSGSGRSADVQGLMCKIFPESSKRSSYRMEDAEGEQGIYMGSVDMKNRAHGQGFLDYDDGKRFIGYFHLGSMSDGVLYRGAHVVHTMRDGEWDEAVNETLVQEHNVNILVYDASDTPHAGKRHDYSGYHKGSNRRRGSGDMSLHSAREPYTSRRPGRTDTMNEDAFVRAIPVEGGASVLENYGNSKLPAFQGSARFIDDIDETSHRSNVRTPVRKHGSDRYEGSVSGFRSNMRVTDDLDVPHSRRSHTHDRNQLEHTSRGLELPVSPGKMQFIDDDDYSGERKYNTTRDRGYGLGSRSVESFEPRRAFNANMDLDLDGPTDEKTVRSHDQLPSSVMLDEIGTLTDNVRAVSIPRSYGRMSSSERLKDGSASQLRRGVASQLPRFNQDNISVLSDTWNAGRKNNMRDSSKKGEEMSLRSAAISTGRGLPAPNHQERLDDDVVSLLRTSNNREGRMGTLFEGNHGDDARDVLNTSRALSSASKKDTARPMVLMVDGLVKNVRGANNAILLKGGILKDGVRCIYATGEKFADVEGMSRVVMTLCDSSKKVVEKIDLFGKTTNVNNSPHRLIGENEPIVSKARPGFFYQLECEVKSGYQDTITLAGLICKIIPSSRSAPSFEMTDPEGARGWYIGPVDINGKAKGMGIFHYETGFTFVGEFKSGKWIKGAYYRGTIAVGTMKNGHWDKQVDQSVVSKFPYDTSFFANRQKPKTEYVEQMESNSYSSYGRCC